MFGKNLSLEQQAKLQHSAETLNALCSACEEAYRDFRPRVTELYIRCRAYQDSLTPLSRRRAEKFWQDVFVTSVFTGLIGVAVAVLGLVVGVTTGSFTVTWIGVAVAGFALLGWFSATVAASGLSRMSAEEVLTRMQLAERGIGVISMPNIVKVGESSAEVEQLIRDACRAVSVYEKQLADSQETLLSLPLEEWYPDRFRKAYDAWALYLDGRLKSLSLVKEALQPPAPLLREPSKDRLNMFVSGLNLVATFKPGRGFPIG